MEVLKGITPIISIIILLLIVVAVSGAAYTYIMGYWSGMTGKAIEMVRAYCHNGQVSITVRNIGTDNINAGDVTTQVDWVVGSGTATIQEPGYPIQVGKTADFTHDCGASNVCRYMIVVGRSVIQRQINC